jgi:hypothetical protein
MKKILLAFDATHFSEGAFEFARYMNEKQPVSLTGIFLPQVNFANLWSYASVADAPLFIPLIEGDETSEIQKNIDRFEFLCRKNNIDYRVHKHFVDFALPELKKETRFADLLIVGSESFYKNLGAERPNEYLKDALHNSECPVMVVPEHFTYPETNIISFDGSESSVFAVKQFAFLFPDLCCNKTLLVYAKEEETNLPDGSYIEELVISHFPDLTVMNLRFNPKKYFASWIAGKLNPVLISGAFGRSGISQLLKKSFTADVIRDHKLPVFVAHR